MTLHLERLLTDLRSLGADPEYFAGLLGVRQAKVERWLSGDLIPSSKRLEQLEWYADVLRAERAVDASGLPPCDWIPNWKPPTSGIAEIEAAFRELEAHSATCATCQARARYVEEKLGRGRVLPHASNWRRCVSAVLGSVAGMPGWMRPPVLGAVGLILLVGISGTVRFVFRLVTGQPTPPLVLDEIVSVVGLLVLLGASGGVCVSIVRPFVRQYGDLGDYLTGIAGAFGYCTTLMWAMPRIAPEEMGDVSLRQPVVWIFIVVMSVLFGIAMTKGWKDSAES